MNDKNFSYFVTKLQLTTNSVRSAIWSGKVRAVRIKLLLLDPKISPATDPEIMTDYLWSQNRMINLRILFNT